MSAHHRSRGDSPMVRKQIFLPAELWEQVTAYALELGVKEGQQVSTSEALRRILERSMKRRDQ